MHYASWNGQAEVVQMLIAKGANVNATDKVSDFLHLFTDLLRQYGYSPLCWAAWRGFLDIAQILVLNGAFKHSGAQSALDCSIRRKQHAILKYLLESDPKPDAKDLVVGSTDSSPLYRCSTVKFYEGLELLFAYGGFDLYTLLENEDFDRVTVQELIDSIASDEKSDDAMRKGLQKYRIPLMEVFVEGVLFDRNSNLWNFSSDDTMFDKFLVKELLKFMSFKSTD